MATQANDNTATLFPVTAKDVVQMASSVALQGKLKREGQDDLPVFVEFDGETAYIDIIENGEQVEAGQLSYARHSATGNIVFNGTFKGESCHLTYFAPAPEIAEGQTIESHGKYMRGVLGLGEAQVAKPRFKARRQG